MGRLTWLALAASVPVGLLSCALLVVNNLRDIPSDAAAGKRTLAVLIGDQRTRRAVRGAARCVPFGMLRGDRARARRSRCWPWPPCRWRCPRCGRCGPARQGPALIGALGQTGRLQLAFGALLTIGRPYALTRRWRCYAGLAGAEPLRLGLDRRDLLLHVRELLPGPGRLLRDRLLRPGQVPVRGRIAGRGRVTGEAGLGLPSAGSPSAPGWPVPPTARAAVAAPVTWPGWPAGRGRLAGPRPHRRTRRSASSAPLSPRSGSPRTCCPRPGRAAAASAGTGRRAPWGPRR